MTCPLYKDSTRTCIRKYERVLKIQTFDICISNNYDECPMYNIIEKKVECCEYTPVCDEEMDFSVWDFEHLKNIANNFCFYGKKEKCAIYKLRKVGKDVPKGLQPDGSKILRYPILKE